MDFYNNAQKLWVTLPPGLRRSRTAQWFKNNIKTVFLGKMTIIDHKEDPKKTTKSRNTPSPDKITTIAELEKALQKLDAMAEVSDDELRKGFSQFHMEFPMDLPSDTESEEYRDIQLKLYEYLHGKPYSISNEIDHFDINAMSSRPFPYCTESPTTVGNQLIAIGHLIKTMDLDAKSAILEFGPGWGNTTISLARMGYDVTAIDINDNFLALINERAQRKDIKVTTLQGDFSVISELDKKFDAVIFFECFHHCSNHQKLIADLDSVVAPEGIVVFAAEPITDHFPIPWGLRLDGESLWAIRRHGWLELGFQETYFRQLLSQHGWSLHKEMCSSTPWGEVLVASRSQATQ